MQKQYVLSEQEWRAVDKLISAARIIKDDIENGRWRNVFNKDVDVDLITLTALHRLVERVTDDLPRS